MIYFIIFSWLICILGLYAAFRAIYALITLPPVSVIKETNIDIPEGFLMRPIEFERRDIVQFKTEVITTNDSEEVIDRLKKRGAMELGLQALNEGLIHYTLSKEDLIYFPGQKRLTGYFEILKPKERP